MIGAQGLDGFLAAEAARVLDPDGAERALALLELQRYALSMFSSCGWFFADIGRVEPVQLLRYAARTLELIESLGGRSPRREFLETLSRAHSNDPRMGTGAEIFEAFASRQPAAASGVR